MTELSASAAMASRPPPASAVIGADLIVCIHCDLVQRAVVLPIGVAARCCRCAAPLFRRRSDRSLEVSAALLLGALVLLVMAHLFPILGLELQGQRNDARLLDSVLLAGTSIVTRRPNGLDPRV